MKETGFATIKTSKTLAWCIIIVLIALYFIDTKEELPDVCWMQDKTNHSHYCPILCDNDPLLNYQRQVLCQLENLEMKK